jgi:hypothetical protein
VFSSGKIIHFLNKTLHKQNGVNHASFAAIQTVLEAGMSCALFPMTMDLVFERNSAYLSVISGGETFTSFKIVLCTRIEETSVFCGRKLSM